MRKITSCLAAIAIIMLFASCEYRTPAPIQQQTETVLIPQQSFVSGDWVNALVSFERAVTKPRWDCNGRRLPQDKIVGYERVTETQCVQILGNCCECPGSNVGHGIGNPPAIAYPTNPVQPQQPIIPPVWSNGPDDFSWFLNALLALLLLGGFIAFLMWLSRRGIFASSPPSTSSVTESRPAAPPTPPLGMSAPPSFADFVNFEKSMSPGSVFTYKQGSTENSITKGKESTAKPKADSKPAEEKKQ